MSGGGDRGPAAARGRPDVNHPMGSAPLGGDRTADREVRAVRPVAYLNFLRVLSPAARATLSPTNIADLWTAARNLQSSVGRVQPPGLLLRETPRFPLGRAAAKYSAFFPMRGAAQIAGTQSHVNPGCLPRTYDCQFCLGGRGNRPARNFWPCDEDRVRGTPRTCRGFCRGFFGPHRGRSESSAGRLRETSGCGPCAWPKMSPPRAVWIYGACGGRNRPVSLHVRAAENGYRGLAPWQTAARMRLRGLLFAL